MTLEKSLLSDMHYPTPNNLAEFEINRPVSYTAIANTAKQRSKDISTDDGKTDERTDITSDDIHMGILILKEKNY